MTTASSAPRSALLLVLSTAVAALMAAALVTATPAHAQPAARADRWTEAEKATLAAMRLAALPAAPADPSNAVSTRPEAAALGQRLFADTRLSKNGQVSCASCHLPERAFQDGLPVGRGVGTGSRRTMPIAAAAHSPWLFWDGRKDSLWSQALGPLEDAAEHGANRVQLARLIDTHYRRDYEALFGRFPALQNLPPAASPQGTPAERQAWQAMPEAQRDAVNRVFANLGKAIAAFERTIGPRASRFDRYADAVLAGERAGQQALTTQEVSGLRLFIGKGQCSTCHNGPLLTDQAFHNTGVPPRDPARPDPGRSAALARVQADEFNCLGRYSDAPEGGCQELRFIAAQDPRLEGAFKTPSLRQVAERAPYMHAGQFASLEAVVAHYRRAPAAAIGRSELAQPGQRSTDRQVIRLSDEEARDLVAFLKSLSAEAQP